MYGLIASQSMSTSGFHLMKERALHVQALPSVLWTTSLDWHISACSHHHWSFFSSTSHQLWEFWIRYLYALTIALILLESHSVRLPLRDVNVLGSIWVRHPMRDLDLDTSVILGTQSMGLMKCIKNSFRGWTGGVDGSTSTDLTIWLTLNMAQLWPEK